MKRHKLIQCILIGLAGCLFFSGCAERNVDYDVDRDTETRRFQRGKTGVEQFAGNQEWIDEWAITTSKGNTVKFSVDADIIVPAAEQMSVVEVKETGFDKNYKKSMIKRFFDSEEIYYNDISHLPKKELLELRAKYKLMYEMYPAESYDWKKMQLGNKMRECGAALKEALDTYTLAEDFSMGEFWGTHAGIPYSLSFVEGDMGINSCRGKNILLFPKDVYQVCPQKFRETENLTYEPWDLDSHGVLKENICELSEEEAKKEAQNFVDDLGLEYLSYVYSEHLVWGDFTKNSEWTAAGYVLHFGFGIDDVAFAEFGTEENYWNYWNKKKETEKIQYSFNASMAVYVADTGVIGAIVYNPIDIINVSRGMELLLLDDVRGIIEDQLENYMGFFRFSFPVGGGDTIEFNEMELVYFRVRDRKKPGCYSYIPAWRLADVSRKGNGQVSGIQNPILINAIDGSRINFFDEI